MRKCIVITGASSGIGKACAEYLSDDNVVYGISRTKAPNVLYKQICCDVTNYQELEKAINSIYDLEGRIDVLINNAGMGISGSFEYMDNKKIKKQLDVNILGVINTSKICIPYLKESAGKIINIASLAAIFPIPYQSYYSLTKAAIMNLSCSMANELKPFKVSVGFLLLGDIQTNFTYNRIKNNDESIDYEARVNKSLEKMEKDEQNGQKPEKIAKYISKLIDKKRIPLKRTIGIKNKILVLLYKLLPLRLVNYIISKMYG